MIDKETRERILALVHKEVVPAIGCTEPMAVALCTARAVEELGRRPDEGFQPGRTLRHGLVRDSRR